MPAKGPPNLVASAHCLAIAQRNQEQSLLLRLPAELRTRVYEFTMDTNTDNILHDDYPTWDRHTVSRTSRQIFAETALPYFNIKLSPLRNRQGISFGDPDSWLKLLAKLTPSQQRPIKRAILSWEQMDRSNMADIVTFARALSHQQNLEIVCSGRFQPRRIDVVAMNLMLCSKINVKIVRRARHGLLELS